MDVLRQLREPAAIVIVLATVAVLAAVLAFNRASRLRRFARRHGFAYADSDPSAALRWPGRPSPELGADQPRTVNVIRGERGGRTFTSFDYRCCIVPGALTPAVAVFRGPFEGQGISTDPIAVVASFSVVVVDCPVPPGARTAQVRRGFAPWHVDVGAESTVAWIDGRAAPGELLAVLTELNAMLDLVAGSGDASSDEAVSDTVPSAT